MTASFLVSICIPTFNQTIFLKKTLESISIQTYKNFEVVISDDSTNEDVRLLVEEYDKKFKINYFKNPTSLGSPANWNKALDRAKGDLIKFMHHDDWFSGAGSLQEFVNVFEDPGIAFAFCRSEILNVAENTISYNIPPARFLKALKKNPKILFSDNRVGAPTAVMYKKSMERFDEKIKYVVDLEFYIRFLMKNNFIYIDKALIVNTSHHAGQVTAASMNKETQVGEYTYLYNKIFRGRIPGFRRSLFFIRLFRGYGIAKISEIKEFTGSVPEPAWYFKILIKLANLDLK
jgi:glycosyltransferase involved in cell wall biosynthesis